MPITSVQLERRKAHLGSSDLAALLGLDPRRNKYDLWLEKTGRLEDEAESNDQNNPMIAGQLLEPAVLQWAELKLGKMTRNQYRSIKGRGLPIGVNVDAIVDATGEPVEAKTSGLYGFTNDVFGDEYTDQVPDRIIAQAHGHMLATERDICHVPVFIAFRGFAMFHVPRDQQIAEIIGNEAVDFWEKHVLADAPPTNLTPNLAVVKRMRREPSKTVQIDRALIEKWNSAKSIESAAKKEKEESLATILAHIGDAEAAECGLGVFTYYEQNRAGYTVEPTSFRVARFKKNK